MGIMEQMGRKGGDNMKKKKILSFLIMTLLFICNVNSITIQSNIISGNDDFLSLKSDLEIAIKDSIKTDMFNNHAATSLYACRTIEYSINGGDFIEFKEIPFSDSTLWKYQGKKISNAHDFKRIGSYTGIVQWAYSFNLEKIINNTDFKNGLCYLTIKNIEYVKADYSQSGNIEYKKDSSSCSFIILNYSLY